MNKHRGFTFVELIAVLLIVCLVGVVLVAVLTTDQTPTMFATGHGDIAQTYDFVKVENGIVVSGFSKISPGLYQVGGLTKDHKIELVPPSGKAEPYDKEELFMVSGGDNRFIVTTRGDPNYKAVKAGYEKLAREYARPFGGM